MISERDMVDLIMIRDAYVAINEVLLGKETMVPYSYGKWGAMARIFGLIERNVTENLKAEDYKKAIEILEDGSLKAEERARMLLGADCCCS